MTTSTLRIDLHLHSAISDGTDDPAEVVAAAHAAGVSVMALTDHDTTAGWEQAQAAATRYGITLVKGIELSTSNGNQGQHLLAYEPDPTHHGLVQMLAQGVASREGRTPAILEKIRAAGYEVSAEAVAGFAGGGVVGRPHIADALVEAGICVDRDEAFDRFLKRSGIAYVHRYQPDIEDAIKVVVHAGGVPVIAHPWGRKTHVSEERFAELVAVGLAGIEVDHQEHDAAARDALRGIARNLGLLVTGSSDYHGTGKVDHDPGCNTTDPGQYERLQALLG